MLNGRCLVPGSDGIIFSVITDHGRKTIEYKKFILNRILRIFPLLIFLFSIVICLNRQHSDPVDVLRLLTLQLNTGHSFTGWGHDIWPSGPIWTIAVEFQFYLVFPFLMRFIHQHGWKYIAGLVVLMILARLNMALLNSGAVYHDVCRSIIGRMDQFLIGIAFGGLFCTCRNKSAIRNFHLGLLMAFSLASLTRLFLVKKHTGTDTVAYTALSFPLDASLWSVFVFSYSIFRFDYMKPVSKALAFFGRISYSFTCCTCLLATCSEKQWKSTLKPILAPFS